MAGNTPQTTVSLSVMQATCLNALALKSIPHGEMCLPFRTVEVFTGLNRTHVKRSIRALARKGLAEFHKGLCNLDGEFAGAGYCITPAGQERIGPVEYEDVC